MFCGNCGKKIDDNVQFCPNCGSATVMEANQASASSQGAYAPRTDGSKLVMDTKEKKRSHVGVIAGIIGGIAVVAAVVAVVLFSGVLSSPKGTLTKAMAKSVSAWQKAAEAANLPDTKALAEKKEGRQEFSLQLKSISDEIGGDLSVLEGMRIDLSSGVSLSDRKLDSSFNIAYGSDSLLSGWMAVDNETVTLGCPDFLGKDVYGFNTVTLGEDLSKFSGVPEEVTSISFNIFDTLDAFTQTVEVDEEAVSELVEAIEVEKTDKKAVEVNGHSVECASYHVVIPKSAMKAYINAIEKAYGARKLDEAVIDLMTSFGIPDSELEYIRDDLEDAFSGEEMFEALRQALSEIGDIEMNVYVNGGYVMAAEWEDKIEGTKLELGLYFGGGKNYADDLGMELKVDSGRISVVSTGDHSASGGVYTDETTVTIRDGSDSIKVSSDLSWEPGKDSDNFEWTIKSSGVSVKASGQLTSSKDAMELDLDKLTVSAMGTNYLTLSGRYAMEPYSEPSYASGNATMLASMNDEAILSLAMDGGSKVQTWLENIRTDFPDLYWYLY